MIRAITYLPALCGLALLTASCASVPAEPRAARRAWPPPPAQPRVALERLVRGPADLGIRPSGWRRFTNVLTGSDRGREQFVRPQGVAVDEAGNLCVTDPGAGAVFLFDLAGRRSRRWTGAGRERFVNPVAVARSRGITFVADTGLAKVLAFDDRGRLAFSISNHLARPAGLAVTSNALIVADAQIHRVVVFDLQGRLLRQFGLRGTAPGEFNAPTHVARDPAGRLLVTDSLNFRVQVFDDAAVPLAAIGSVGDSSGHFSRPKGVAADARGNIYVVDALFDNVQVFDRAGRFLMSWGGAGGEPGEFWLPNGIAADAGGRLFVADAYNQRIQVFHLVGQE